MMKRSDWDQRYEGSELVWTARPNEFLVQEVEGLAPGRALDFGCGEGRNAVWLAEGGWRVTGVDFSAVGVDKGRKLAAAREVEVEWLVEDVTTWRPPEQAFDLVAVLYMHVGWPDMQKVLRNAVHAVAPGGVFLLVGHDLSNFENGHGGPPDPAVLYTPEQVAGELSELEVVKAEVVERRVDDDRVALDNLVRAVRRAP
jgi:SAM-dependent methyltransferase